MTHTPQNIAVFGANGAIGAAFLRQLRQRQPHARLQAIARSGFEMAILRSAAIRSIPPTKVRSATRCGR